MMDFKNLLGKLDQLNESVEVVAEEAKTVPQQQAAGAALAAKRGDAPKSELKGASKKMMNMSEKELEKIAGTKHKGLPKKKKTESLDEANIQEGVVSDMKLSPEMQEKIKNASDEELNKMAFGTGDDSLRAGDDFEMLKKARAELRRQSESFEEANESPEQRLKALGDLYNNAMDTIKRTENIMYMTPPGANRDYYEMEIGQMQKHAAKIKKDYQALQSAMKGADDIRAQASAESFDSEAFRAAFEEMVEAKGKMPDFPDVDGDGDTEEPIGDAQKDKEAKDGDKKDTPKKGLSAKQKKLPPGLQKAIAKKNEDINESFDKFFTGDKLTFEEAVKIVRESGGQQKIDPVDTALWNWAQRVATNKFEESRKAEMFAGLIYERNGGEFQLHDVLSEDSE